MSIRIAIAGIGGYGVTYVSELLRAGPEREIQVVGAIDPAPERCPLIEPLREAGVPVFADLAEFYAREQADLTIISAPIHLHAPLTCLALAHGSHVLCEKPLGASAQDAAAMLAAERQAGRQVAIGYQWSYSQAVLDLKQAIAAGRFGRPLAGKCLVLWSRGHAYYRRNDWAGRIHSAGGDWVLDSPVNNATAHYLHNLLFLLGQRPERAARPTALQAELYRANAIENYDSAALRVSTADGPDLLFLTAHPVLGERGPVIELAFENAVVKYPTGENGYTAHFHDGHSEWFGSPWEDESSKLWMSVEAARANLPVVCGLRAAIPQLACTLAAQQTPIHAVEPEAVLVDTEGGDPVTWVRGMARLFDDCYTQGRLPSELGGEPWVRPAQPADLEPYASLLDEAAA